MSGFIRPELRTVLWRWRDVLGGVAVIALGLWVFFAMSGWVAWLGIVLLMLGSALVWTGSLKARFGDLSGGPGVLDITERRLTYFASDDSGGTVSIDDITRVEVVTTGTGPIAPDLFWLFYSDAPTPLAVPGNAEGAEAIFDALAALPGVNYEQAIAAAGSTSDDKFLIWQKDRRRLH